jgi:hypothetical protein
MKNENFMQNAGLKTPSKSTMTEPNRVLMQLNIEDWFYGM